MRRLRFLSQLDDLKGQFGPQAAERAEVLLGKIVRERYREASDLIHLHETLLFLRAYPQSPAVLRLSDEVLFSFADRLPADLADFDDPEISGIGGTCISTAFSYEFVRSLSARHPVEIDWDNFEHPERLTPALAKLIPESRDDWAVEAHPDYRRWFEKGNGSVKWLLGNLTPETYNLMEIPVLWTPGDASRSHLRLPRREIFYHDGPFMKSSGLIRNAFIYPPLRRTAVGSRKAAKIAALIVEASAVRYRELYGFLYPDLTGMEHSDFGRGVDVFLFGPTSKLPVRDYLCGMFFKNGVPMGYIEGLTRDGNMEVGFNLYYTFRGGETVWLYLTLLRLLHARSGATSFSVDPYQIGHENEEAIASGAFWFYRKRGFIPESKDVLRLLAREERRMEDHPEYRTPPEILRKLAESRMVYRI